MTDRQQYIEGLRTLATMLDENPDLDLPSDGDHLPIIMWPQDRYTDSEKESYAKLVRTVRNYTREPMTKDASSSFMNLHTALGGPDGLSLQLTANRDRVCERVVVGTETVTKTVPDPERVAKIPQVEVTEEVELVEWKCGAILGDTVEEGKTSDADAA